MLDTLAPTWSVRRKAIVSLVVAAIVAALIFFGVRNDPTPAPTATQAESS